MGVGVKGESGLGRSKDVRMADQANLVQSQCDTMKKHLKNISKKSKN